MSNARRRTKQVRLGQGALWLLAIRGGPRGRSQARVKEGEAAKATSGKWKRLAATPGFKGHDPDSNGPHPSAGIGGYAPRARVFTDGTVDFEPLAVRWDSGGMEVVLPDQGLLMTYGLSPRYTRTRSCTGMRSRLPRPIASSATRQRPTCSTNPELRLSTLSGSHSGFTRRCEDYQ